MSILKRFFQHNWLMIFYLNFKCLPFSQAIKLPIDIYRGIRINSLKGKIVINAGEIHRGMIKFGGQHSEMFAINPCIIDLKDGGEIVFSGCASIGVGCYLRINDNAKFILGDHVVIGAYTKVMCYKYIEIGERTRVSWECQIMDSNTHYLKDIEKDVIFERDAPIILGAYNWVGNRCTIMKGVKMPNNTIIASNSLCNKDFSNIEEYSIIGGQPAKFIKSGIKRLFEGVDL